MKNFIKKIICIIIAAFLIFPCEIYAEPVTSVTETVDPPVPEVPSDEEAGDSGGESGGESAGSPDENFSGDSLNGSAPEISEKITYYITSDDHEYCVYEPLGDNKADKICFMLIPSEEEVNSFMEMTEWPFFSATDNFAVVCLQTDWSSEESAEAYYEAVYNEVSSEYISENSSVFIIGYENGADYACYEACLNHDRYTGLVAFGGSGLSEEQQSFFSDKAGDWALSVWLVRNNVTQSLTDNITFWKKINGISEGSRNSYNISYTDQLYLPATSSAERISSYSEEMGAVFFSRKLDYYSGSAAAMISRNFITKVSDDSVSFDPDINGGEIYEIKISNFRYFRKQFEGQQRDYWIYTPGIGFAGAEPSSLISCLHGSGQNGENMIYRTMWHDKAEENNCVVVYPSSLYTFGNFHYWMNIDSEMDFLRDLIETVCEDYNIDRSRIYVTGFSNGAGMAQNLAINFSDIIAAAALSAPAYFDEEYYGVPDNIAPVAILFSFGTEDTYLKSFNMTPEIDDEAAESHLAYWRGLYEFEQDSYVLEEKDIFRMYTYSNKEGIPICRWMIIEGKTHSYPKEEVAPFYDFLSSYTKGENGELYYNGQQVSAMLRPYYVEENQE
ncbi:MAG: hypothetical protein HUJ76_01585 [Parasporobacterium sp.]|nr:hypothetical protein [Parasporobacterium sp.]